MGEGKGVKLLQRSAKRRFSGLGNFVAVYACHFCLAMHAAFTQPGDHLLAIAAASVLSSLTPSPRSGSQTERAAASRIPDRLRFLEQLSSHLRLKSAILKASH